MKKNPQIRRLLAGFLCLTLMLSGIGMYGAAESTLSTDPMESPSLETEESHEPEETNDDVTESDENEQMPFTVSDGQDDKVEVASSDENQIEAAVPTQDYPVEEEPVQETFSDEWQEPYPESDSDDEPAIIPDDPVPSSTPDAADTPNTNEDADTPYMGEEPVAPATDEVQEEPPLGAEQDELPLDEAPDEPLVDEAQDELLTAEDMNELPLEEEQENQPILASIGDYVEVTTSTRVYTEVDNDAVDEPLSSFFVGFFVSRAVVKVIDVPTDENGHAWYRVEYRFGADMSKGGYAWTDTDTVYVLAEETMSTEEISCTVTDYAYSKDILYMMSRVSLRSSPMSGFSLRERSGSVGSFSAGQSGLYGSSGKDSDYPQLAKSASHGTIYATPHYLEGYRVYCLEHTLNGPGEGSGSNMTATGPYKLYSMSSYVNDPAAGGLNGVRFKAKTMHAIGWIVRHSYPFMVLDRSDSDNSTWSRVAGQFAIREVIKELEGSRYVRSYWDMDSFYSFSGGAPSVYLTYARWLASNALDYANITGSINTSNKSVSLSGSNYVGSVRLTTDADLIRIPKSAGAINGNSAGSDSSYYYARSGDTIQVTSSSSRFSIPMESVPSDDEEAAFLVGVPSVSIQKIIVPVYGSPTPYQSLNVSFELSEGAIAVTKKSTDGALLKGAVFELLNSTGTVLKTATTGANGTASFPSITPGTYTVREKTAPQGYLLSPTSTQNVTITAGKTATVTFTNERITGKVRVVKKDSATGKPLPGAVFAVTRLTVPASENATNIGQVVATITTNADGVAETGLLPWGQYRITETSAPNGYLNDNYATTVTIQ